MNKQAEKRETYRDLKREEMHTDRILQEKKPGQLIKSSKVFLLLVLNVIASTVSAPMALAAGATTSLHIMKYAEDGTNILAEKTVTYQWMEENLPVQGDGITHYYHQGPVFEGDSWDPEEMVNLKDKGAVRGTDIKDLCELVGGMAPGDEVMVCAIDGYCVKFAYTNVYNPLPRQGPIVLCWYKGEDTGETTYHETGYPGNDAYGSAIQLVFMAKTKNPEGKFVFGNDDMRVCLPQEEYQHFYEGLPSTNGLSTKWVSEIRVYAGAPEIIQEDDFEPVEEVGNQTIPRLPIVLGSLGLGLFGWSLYLFSRREAARRRE